jgi:dTDP-glucose pyrophosphorylase
MSIEMNVIIPMAGRGQRFTDAGFTTPKPFIEVRGKPMIQLAVENLNMDCPHIFIMQAEHYEKYGEVMKNFMPKGSKIIQIDEITHGPVCTCLKAEGLIDNDEPLIYANCDQYLQDWGPLKYDSQRYIDENDGFDGCLLVTRNRNPWGSFATVDPSGYVNMAVEKIMPDKTDISSTGIYMWSKGSDFVRNAKQMITDNKCAPNGEFYAIDVYNQGIKEGKKYVTHFIKNWWRLGVPEDLAVYLKET